MLDCLDVPSDVCADHPDRAIYCSRTLNLRSIPCIGYDLDYVSTPAGRGQRPPPWAEDAE